MEAVSKTHRCCGQSRWGFCRVFVLLVLLGLAFVAGATTSRVHDFHSMGLRNHLMMRTEMPMDQRMDRMMRKEDDNHLMILGNRMMVMERKGGMNATGTRGNGEYFFV